MEYFDLPHHQHMQGCSYLLLASRPHHQCRSSVCSIKCLEQQKYLQYQFS